MASLIGLLGASCRGQSAPLQPAAPADPPSIVDRLPADVSLVVCIKDADRQRRSAPGRAVMNAISGARFFAETQAAWVNLATLLGWLPEEAFVRLAGRQLVFALAGVEGDPARPWALLSDVDGEAERRLLSRLRPAPRKTVAGQPVLSLEDGRFEIAVVCTARGKGDPESCMIVLAPTGRGDLLDRIVGGLAGGGAAPGLGDVPALRDAAGLLDSDIFVMGLRDGGESREQFVLAAAMVEDGWKASLRASPGLLFSDGVPAEPVPPWSSRAVADLAPDAVALMMADNQVDFGLWAPMLRLPALNEATERLRGLVGRRMAVGLFRARGPEGTTPGIALAFGADAPDINALAGPADAVVGRLVGVLESEPGEGDRPDFEGFLPEAPRVVRLHGTAAAVWRPLLGPRPVLTWAFRGAPGADAAREKAGWWSTALAPSDQRNDPAEWVSEFSARLAAADEDADARPRVAVGMVRVYELVRWLSDIRADPTGALTPFRCLESVQWDTWMSLNGRIEGTATVRTMPAS